MAGKKNYELEIMISGGTDASLAASIKEVQKQIDKLAQKAKLSKADIENSFGGMSGKGIDALASISDKAFGAVLTGGKMAAAGITAAFGAAATIGMGYESQMSTVQAISQASEADMKKLNALAKEMGETTQFTAEQAGQGLEYMAMAGWKTEDMLNGLPGIMYLAAASGEDLGSVSDIVTDAMTAFGMQASESSHFADVLAQASANANTNVSMMGNTFQYVAPVAGAFGYTVEDVALGVGLMANAGIKAEKAGTAMRAMLTNLAKPTKQVQGYMDKLSLSLADSSGNMKPYRQLLQELRQKFDGLTESQKAEYAAGIAGKEGMSGLLAILSASDADFNKLAESIDNSTGAAQKMSEVRLDNLKGDLTLLGSAAQGLGIEAYGGFSGGLRELTQDATKWIGEATEKLKTDMPTIQRHAKNFKSGIESAFGPVVSFGKWCIRNPNVIQETVTGIAAALGVFKGVQTAKNAVKLFGTLSGMVSAWPVAAAGLVIGGIAGISTAITAAEKAAARANLDRHFGDITLSVEELDDAARHIVSGGGNLFEQLDNFHSASDDAKQLASSLQSSLAEIKRSDWKLSMGFDFDADDTQSYVDSIDSYLKNAQDYITNSGYEMKVAIGLVFGEDSTAGAELAESSGAFYQSLYQQLQPLEQSLQDVMADITANGLDLPKQQMVDDYLGQISEITSMITDAENAAKLQMIGTQYSGADLLSGDTFQNLQQSIQEYTEDANAGIDESYQKILTSLNAQRLAGEKGMEGGITQAEFDAQSNEALTAYYNQQAEVISNGYTVMRDAIMNSYGDEIGPALDTVNAQIQEELPKLMENNTTPEQFVASFGKLFTDVLNASDMSADAKNAVSMLLQNMLPAQEDMEQLRQQMKAAGVSPSAIVTDMLDEMSEMGAVTGDSQDIWTMIGNQIASDENYSLLTATVQQQTGQIPDAAIEAITARNPDVEDAAKSILQTIQDTFAGGVQAEIPISLNTVTQYRAGNLTGTIAKSIEHHASGGLMDKPTLSWFAEESPEMAIPIDGSNRSIGLWQETGRMLGAYDFGEMQKNFTDGISSENTNSFAPVYNPVIQVQGSGNVAEQVASGLKEGYEQFVEYMERFQREQYRAAF